MTHIIVQPFTSSHDCTEHHTTKLCLFAVRTSQIYVGAMALPTLLCAWDEDLKTS